jgi:hypothetical protein
MSQRRKRQQLVKHTHQHGGESSDEDTADGSAQWSRYQDPDGKGEKDGYATEERRRPRVDLQADRTIDDAETISGSYGHRRQHEADGAGQDERRQPDQRSLRR